MPNQGRALDQIETRLVEWILYLLRGGKAEVLERVLESGAYPADSKYALLRSILTDDRSGIEGVLRDGDRDLLIGANPGYILDLDPENPDDRERLNVIISLVRLVKIDLLLAGDAILRRMGAFRDQVGHTVDIDLKVQREQFRRLLGDLLSWIAENGAQGDRDGQSIYSEPAHLLDERSRSLLRYFMDRWSAAPLNARWPDSGVVPNLVPQDVPFPYLTQLQFREDVGVLFPDRQKIQTDNDGEERAEEANLDAMVWRASDMVFFDPDQTLLLIREELGIPETLQSYQLLTLLGVGLRTVTFRAVDKDSINSQQVALRVILRPDLPNDCASYLSLHSHEAILPYQRFLRTGSFVFLVSEYMPGGNLADLLETLSGSRRLRVLLQALVDACEALAFAHQRGMFHDAITLEKILFSPNTGRFRLAHFRLPLLSLVGPANVAAEECLMRAVQKDLHDLASVFSDLLQEEQVPWLKYILVRCVSGGFENARELLDKINRYLHSDRTLMIVLTATYDDRTETIHYDLDVGGWRSPEILDRNVTRRTISDICARWERIGDLAKERAEGGRPVEEVDLTIRKLLLEVSKNATQIVLGQKVRGGLEGYPEATLWVRYDPRLSSIPWELLEIGDSRACHKFQIARSPRLSISVPHPGLPMDRKLRMLFIEDPYGDLPGAIEECELLRENIRHCNFAGHLDIRTIRHDDDAIAVRNEMLESDIIHFAGHALFRETETEDSGLGLGKDDIFRASHIKDFWSGSAPFLIFANACSSGRTSRQTSWRRIYTDAMTGLGQAFLAAGVANYIGTLWSTPDRGATVDFALEFYRWFFSGATVSRAIRAARNVCNKKYGEEDLTWARYVLFGNPLSRIRI